MTATALYAVIGHPVGHSKSPWIHAQFAAQTGEPVRYTAIEAAPDAFLPTLRAFFDQGGQGMNVTVPFKLDAYQAAAPRVSERARLAGAVNTVWQEEGALYGCNTDGVGLMLDLRRLDAPLDTARVLIIGAGGAARGIIRPLLDSGCRELVIANRTASRAQALTDVFSDARLSACGLDQIPVQTGFDLVINASSSSLGDQAPPLPRGLYRGHALAYDLVYAARPTPFMEQAQQDGAARQADGLGMLVGQAAESFFIWRGVRPELAPVLQALRQSLSGQ